MLELGILEEVRRAGGMSCLSGFCADGTHIVVNSEFKEGWLDALDNDLLRVNFLKIRRQSSLCARVEEYYRGRLPFSYAESSKSR